MTKAEERCNEYQGCTDSPYARTERDAFLAGYEQAEKDVLKDARWIEIYDDTTWKMVDDFVHQNMDGAYRIIIVKR